jgi:hypothetical protein
MQLIFKHLASSSPKSLFFRFFLPVFFVALAITTLVHIVNPTPKVPDSLVLQETQIQRLQLPTTVGQTVRWSVLVKRSDIQTTQDGQHYIKLPKGATVTNVKQISKAEGQHPTNTPH